MLAPVHARSNAPSEQRRRQADLRVRPVGLRAERGRGHEEERQHRREAEEPDRDDERPRVPAAPPSPPRTGAVAAAVARLRSSRSSFRVRTRIWNRPTANTISTSVDTDRGRVAHVLVRERLLVDVELGHVGVGAGPAVRDRVDVGEHERERGDRVHDEHDLEHAPQVRRDRPRRGCASSPRRRSGPPPRATGRRRSCRPGRAGRCSRSSSRRRRGGSAGSTCARSPATPARAHRGRPRRAPGSTAPSSWSTVAVRMPITTVA